MIYIECIYIVADRLHPCILQEESNFMLKLLRLVVVHLLNNLGNDH